MTMWPLLPEELRGKFKEQFSDRIINSPQERMTEMQWVDVFISLRDHLMKCPHCGDETFVYGNQPCLNPRCRKPIQVTYVMDGAGRSIPLIKGNIIRFERTGVPSGVVIDKNDASGLLLIKNLTEKAWTVLTPSGKSLSVAPGGFMPVKQDLVISTIFKFKINK